VKDRLGDQKGGSEWEPIKILLEGDRNSNKMNPLGRTPKITRSAPLPSVCQNHIATEVLLVLRTNTTSSLNSNANTAVGTTREPADRRRRSDQVWGRLDRLHLVTKKSSEKPLPSTKTPHSFTSRNLLSRPSWLSGNLGENKNFTQGPRGG
jgi:hypothetical protein